MASGAIRAFKTSLESGNFDRVYLFLGDEDYLKEENVRALIDRATDVATREFNLDVRYGSEIDAGNLSLCLDSLPVMATRRVVVIRGVNALKKDARAALARYLKNPAADVVLVMVADADAKPDAALTAAATVVEYKTLGEADLTKWVMHRAATVGVSIEPRAADLLSHATGSDLAMLAGEIDKLREYTNGRTINEAAVTAVVGVRPGETMADLLDCLAARDGTRAIAMLDQVLSQPKTTAVSILMALTTQTLAIGWVLAARARGVQQHRLESELFGLLKENPSALVGRPWGEGVKCWVGAMKHWDQASIDRAVDALCDADLLSKDTRVSSDEQLLTTLFLSMTRPGHARAA